MVFLMKDAFWTFLGGMLSLGTIAIPVLLWVWAANSPLKANNGVTCWQSLSGYGCTQDEPPADDPITARCSDGSEVRTIHASGTCGHHGGVQVWVDQGMKEEANAWCDQNPVRCQHSHWQGIEGHGYHKNPNRS